MAYLSCENLSVGYAGKAVAEGLAFSVGPGDMLSVVGENGAGKSTLMKTILGLIPPVAGAVAYGDGLNAADVGYLPQRGESQRDFPASAWEIALSGRLPRIGRRPFFGRADRDAAREALERVGASDFASKPFSTLSGGQQQRVLLARALCAASKVIVLDEPMTGLDPQAAAALYDTLDGLRAEGMAVIAVSHDVDEAVARSSQVLEVGGPGGNAAVPAAGFRARRGEGAVR